MPRLDPPGNYGTEPDFSICVATHNRSGALAGLFANLATQAGASFELVIVNDGSTDKTAATLDTLAADAPFPVAVVNAANGGRGSALNHAFDRARGRFIFILDDDDFIAPGALADILSTWTAIPADKRAAFCGVCGLCSTAAGTIVGQQFPASPIDADFFSMRIVRGVRGDKREVVLRSAIGDFRFPSFPGEKRVSTNLLWFDLAARYQTRFVNRTWVIKDYRPDGITANGLKHRVTSANLTRLYYEKTLSLFPDMPLTTRLRFIVNYLRFAKHANEPLATSLGRVNDRLMTLLSAPVARAIAWNDRRLLAKRSAA
jgi:glycosyltransferase involved in cell wall biosynthesis